MENSNEKLFGTILFSKIKIPEFDSTNYSETIEVSNFTHFINCRKKIELLKEKTNQRILIIVYNKLFFDLFHDLNNLFEMKEFNFRDYISEKIKFAIPLQLQDKSLIDLKIVDYLEELTKLVNSKKIKNDKDFIDYLLSKVFIFDLQYINKIETDERKFILFFDMITKSMDFKDDIFDSIYFLVQIFTNQSILEGLSSSYYNLIYNFINKNRNKSDIQSFINRICWTYFVGNFSQIDQKEFFTLQLNEIEFSSFSNISYRNLEIIVDSNKKYLRSYIIKNQHIYNLIDKEYSKIFNKLSLNIGFNKFNSVIDFSKMNTIISNVLKNHVFLFNINAFELIDSMIASYMITSFQFGQYNEETIASFISSLINKSYLLFSLENEKSTKFLSDNINELENLNGLILYLNRTSEIPNDITEWLTFYDTIMMPLYDYYSIVFEGKLKPLHLDKLKNGSNYILSMKNKYKATLQKLNDDFIEEIINNFPEFCTSNFQLLSTYTPKQIVSELENNNRVIYLVFDGLPYFSWIKIKKLFDKNKFVFDLNRPVLSMIPTITYMSRKALFAGMLPRNLYLKSKNKTDYDKNKEKEMLKSYLDKNLNRDVNVKYESDLTVEVLRYYLDLEKEEFPDVLVFLIKIVDKIQHSIGKADASVLKNSIEEILDEHISNILEIAKQQSLVVISTCDHGAVICETKSTFPDIKNYKKDKISIHRGSRHIFITSKLNTTLQEKKQIILDIEEMATQSNDIFITHDQFLKYNIPDYWGDYEEELLCCIIANSLNKFSWAKHDFAHGGLSLDEMIVNNSLLRCDEITEIQELIVEISKDCEIISNQESNISLKIINNNKFSIYNFELEITEQDFKYKTEEIKTFDNFILKIPIFIEEGIKSYKLTLFCNYEILSEHKEIKLLFTLDVKKGKTESIIIDRSADKALDDLLKNM